VLVHELDSSAPLRSAHDICSTARSAKQKLPESACVIAVKSSFKSPICKPRGRVPGATAEQTGALDNPPHPENDTKTTGGEKNNYCEGRS
jgi:hypothetical protein